MTIGNPFEGSILQNKIEVEYYQNNTADIAVMVYYYENQN